MMLPLLLFCTMTSRLFTSSKLSTYLKSMPGKGFSLDGPQFAGRATEYPSPSYWVAPVKFPVLPPKTLAASP